MSPFLLFKDGLWLACGGWQERLRIGAARFRAHIGGEEAGGHRQRLENDHISTLPLANDFLPLQANHVSKEGEGKEANKECICVL